MTAWVLFNAAGEYCEPDGECWELRERPRSESLLPARCRSCGRSTMVDGNTTDGYECIRCGESVSGDDVKYPRTEAELVAEIAAALFPAVCAFCGAEMIASYAKIGVIDCRGFGECNRAETLGAAQ